MYNNITVTKFKKVEKKSIQKIYILFFSKEDFKFSYDKYLNFTSDGYLIKISFVCFLTIVIILSSEL